MGAIASASGSFAQQLSPDMAQQLVRWLTPARDRRPRLVWPAQITLTGGSVSAHRQLFGELVRSNPTATVMDGAVDAWLFRTTVQVLDELAPLLRAQLQGNDPDVLQTRARLEGRRFEWDPQARGWIAASVLNGPSPRVAGTAIKTIADVVNVSGSPLSRSNADWLADLVPSMHSDAARRVLILLRAPDVVDDTTFEALAPRIAPLVTARFSAAIRANEDPQVVQAALDCLIRVDGCAPVDPNLVRTMFDALAQFIPKMTQAALPTNTTAAAIRTMTNLCGTLMSRRLPAEEIRERIAILLADFEPAAVANKSVRSIGSMLNGIVKRGQAGPEWLDDLFGRETTTLGVRLAIAEALLDQDNHRTASRAAGLKDRSDCPPEVVAYILPRLRG
jgi:hypothetical protein